MGFPSDYNPEKWIQVDDQYASVLSTYKASIDVLNTHALCDSRAISGVRFNCTALLIIDMKHAIVDGLVFYKSKNNVILCAGDSSGCIPPRYISHVFIMKK